MQKTYKIFDDRIIDKKILQKIHLIFSKQKLKFTTSNKRSDYVVTIGGDGTILRAFQKERYRFETT